MKTAVLWTLVGVQVLGALIIIGRIGKERKPYTPTEAVVGVILTAAIVAGYFYLASA